MLIKQKHVVNPEREVNEIKVIRSRWRYIFWGILVVIIGIIAWVVITGLITLNKITSANSGDGASFFALNNITPADVKKEGDSRINILLAGIGGPGHDGPDLTDTLQVASIDPVNKTMAMVSVPRDLYVTQATGERSKINAVNADGVGYCKIKKCATGVDPGGAAMKDMVGKVLGIQIEYFARIDFNGFKEIVDSVGGIDINVPTSLYDPLYPLSDTSNAYTTVNIKAGQQHMNGDTALKYVRSRETTSDFDRSKRQQLVLEAVRTKAKTVGVLSNPATITNLLNALGNNFKTDLQLGDLNKMLSLMENIDSTKNTVNVLDTSVDGPLKQLNDPQAGYIIIPKLGMNNYLDVQKVVQKYFPDPYIVKEHAKVTLINASGKPSASTLVIAELKNLGYNVISITEANRSQTASSISGNNSAPFTESLLKQHFNATQISSAPESGADITLTFGSKYLITK